MTQGISIVIPAHNEGAVIERTLRSVWSSRTERELQVIVVANGCTDDTAERARRFKGVEVIETAVGSKIAALNLGDRAARHFPRAYMDADVVLSENLIETVARAFEEPEVRIVAPEVRYAYSWSNPFLAGYYRLWSSLPYVRRDMMARGFYAMDRELRSRFDEFPTLVADDKFIRNLTRPQERRIAQGCWTTVHLPGTFRELLAVKTRWTYGNLELAERRPELNVNDQSPYEGAMRWLAVRPWHWVNVPTFVGVYAYTRWVARRRLKQKRGAWERAESSRVGRLSSPS